MSEASTTSTKAATNKAEPRTRRISSPRSKKSVKSAKPEADAKNEVTQPAKFPEFPSSAESPSATNSDWPEPEPASSGAGSGQENPKRKRRRKKGKGGAQSQALAANDPSDLTGDVATNTQQQTKLNHPPRVKVDAEQLAKFAWKIYLAEVSEEGVALLGDNDARELSRRCFRLAEIFLEEQGRRR